MRGKLWSLLVRMSDFLMWGLVAFAAIAGVLGAVAGAMSGVAAITLWIMLVGRSTVLIPILVTGLLVVALSRGIYKLHLKHPQAISKRMVMSFWLLAGIGFPAVIIEAVYGPLEGVYRLVNAAGDSQLVDRKFPTRPTPIPPKTRPSEKLGTTARPAVSAKRKEQAAPPRKTAIPVKPAISEPKIEMRKSRPATSAGR